MYNIVEIFWYKKFAFDTFALCNFKRYNACSVTPGRYKAGHISTIQSANERSL